MQPETFEAPQEIHTPDPPQRLQPPATQHGQDEYDGLSSPAYSQPEEYGGVAVSGSEWSLSNTPTESGDNWLNGEDASLSETVVLERPEKSTESPVKALPGSVKSHGASSIGSRRDRSPLQELPEELLFYVISHLGADDLLAVKLVSRRFNDIVSSPHAWINAFARYFPGPNALRATADTDETIGDLKTEKRSFTRLMPVSTWTGEYLQRTKLLRCLNRGRPALPFACPAPGKTNKGYATFTFSSRLRFGISHLHANFGPVMDKRLPQFIHGLSDSGTVTSSDKRGKFDGWGMTDRISFQVFSELYPGTAQWGLGTGEVVGVPNVMDLSTSHGMIYGEGLPGGHVYYLANGEKHGRYLPPFLAAARYEHGMIKVSNDEQAICSVWIAKSNSVPSTTKGVVGLLSGSSNGVVSAYSLGLTNDREQRFERGELTARWLLSPGVPIVALAADDHFTDARYHKRRIWAVALNALGEVFVLQDLPTQSVQETAGEAALEYMREARAWSTGKSTRWHLVHLSQRSERQISSEPDRVPEYYPRSVWHESTTEDSSDDLFKLQAWATRSPANIMLDFNGWDMRRRLEVDFSGDDGKDAGENILVFDHDSDDGNQAAITRYSRCTLFQQNEIPTVAVSSPELKEVKQQAQQSLFNAPTWSFEATGHQAVEQPEAARSHQVNPSEEAATEWRSSQLTFGRLKNVKLTATALDGSKYAVTTCREDEAFGRSELRDTTGSKSLRPGTSVASDLSPLKAPGQRSRFVAAGSTSGTVFIWDIRAPPSGHSKVINTIQPFRVIHTDSPEISSLALTALYLVHGGSEGLVQAWDVLASTLEPVRTISSRNTLNARRRAVIAAQNNPIVQVQMATSSYAASAICLDPDPAILRGVVAMGSHLRYWSYSSAAATDDLSKSQKRRINRAMRGLNSSSGDTYLGTRRVSLKGVVGQQILERNLELKEKRAEERHERRIAGRFGTDLLGDDASEEQLLAYAKLLSQEEQEKRIREAMALQAKLPRDATEAEVEAYLNSLGEEDRLRWRYASWEERFEMPVSDSGTATRSPNVVPGDDDYELAEALRLSLDDSPESATQSRSKKLPSPSPLASSAQVRTPYGEEDDLERALRLSLGDSPRESPSLRRYHDAGSSSKANGFPTDEVDDETAEAIRLSLAEAEGHLHPSSDLVPKQSQPEREAVEHQSYAEDELETAIRLSLQEQGTYASPPLGTSAGSRIDEDEFPTLSSSQPSTPASGSGRKSKGKGKSKDRVIWG